MHAARSFARAARPCVSAVASAAPSVAARPARAFSPATFSPRSLPLAAQRLYSTGSAESVQEPAATPQPGGAQPAGDAAAASEGAAASGSDPKVEEMSKLLDEQKKLVAELKVRAELPWVYCPG